MKQPNKKDCESYAQSLSELWLRIPRDPSSLDRACHGHPELGEVASEESFDPAEKRTPLQLWFEKQIARIDWSTGSTIYGQPNEEKRYESLLKKMTKIRTSLEEVIGERLWEKKQ